MKNFITTLFRLNSKAKKDAVSNIKEIVNNFYNCLTKIAHVTICLVYN